MRQQWRALILCLPVWFAAPPDAAASSLTLWYTTPAEDWETEALPIGNGAMGAMVFGGVAIERLQFNEKTLWTGGPGSSAGYDFGVPRHSMRHAVEEIARRVEEASALDAEEVAKRLGRRSPGYGDYQSFGELSLELAESDAPVREYRRELDLQNAIVRVHHVQNGVRYLREYFASYPDGVIVVRLSADRPGNIAFRARLVIPDNRTVHTRIRAGRITAAGALHDNGLEYEAAAQILTSGGRRTDEAEAVTVAGADSAIVVLGAGTSYRQSFPRYRGVAPHRSLHERVDKAAAAGYSTLLARHTADHRALFDRVALDLGPSVALPTDQLLARYGQGDTSADRALEALYFQYGRYLLIASSRAGSLPANLQGVWNHSNSPPWNADYHVNINLQMNYWPAESTNLPETALPLFDFIDSLMAPGRRAARQIVGASGWTLFLNTNVWGFTGLIDWPTAFWQPEAAAWLAQHYYEHYRYSQDERFLRERAWPAMKGAARFWLDALRPDPRDGLLVVSPSYSPEHGPFTAGAAISQQIVYDLFVNTAEAATILGERAFGARVKAALRRLDPGTRVGSWGQLQEWKADLDDPASDHRHVSHLFALHPGRQISLQDTRLARAARISLDARGDGGTGWSKAWKINFWARLLDGDRAHRLFGELLRGSTLKNLLDTHPPFQIDGNFGATAGMAEMLLQSHGDALHLLPALPSAWRTGRVAGLRARGGLTVDIVWLDGDLDEATLHVTQPTSVAIRIGTSAIDSSGIDSSEAAFRLFDAASEREIPVSRTGDSAEYSLERAGHYLLRRKN